MKSKIKQYIGDKSFYKMAFAIIIPVVIQQIVISISGYVDNLMINSYSSDAYMGVSTANRFIFILISLWIGATAGVSIFVAQFFGAKKRDRLVGVMQLSIIIVIVIGIISSLLVAYLGPVVIRMFIKGEKDSVAIKYGDDYLKALSYGIIIMFANMMLSNIYRSMKNIKLPLITGVIGIFVNVFFNYILINGKLGCPELRVTGAAIATLIGNGVQVLILIIYALFISKDKYIYSIFKSLEINKYDTAQYFKKGFPVAINEILWAISMQLIALLITRPDTTGERLDILNYTTNITDLFYVYFSGIATGVAVLVGGTLGSGDLDRAKDYAKKMVGITIMAAFGVIILIAAFTPALLFLFKLKPGDDNGYYLKTYYTALVFTTGVIPYGVSVVLYYIIRSGGDTLRAFLVDQVPTWTVSVTVSYLLYDINPNWGKGTFLIIYFIIRSINYLKMIFTIYVYRKETWVRNLTIEKSPIKDPSLNKKDINETLPSYDDSEKEDK